MSPLPSTCPLCDATGPKSGPRQGDWRYALCATCGTAWLDPLPSDEELSGIYTRAYFEGGIAGGYGDYAADEELHRRNAKARLALIAGQGSEAGRILDIGCALGFFVHEAQQAGWEAVGVERSQWSAERAREAFSLRVVPSMDELLVAEGESFDVVSFFQVLEHMRDPVAALRQAHALLRPGGLLVVETWDRSSAVARLMGSAWQQVNPPSVLHLFDRGSLDRLCTRCGFEPGRIGATSKQVSVGFVTGLLADSYGFMRPIHGLVGRGALGRMGFGYRLGDLITGFARKPA